MSPSGFSLLLDLAMERVALEVRIVLLLLDALGDGFLVPLGEIAGHRFALFTRLGALQDDLFLHDRNGLKGQRKPAAPRHASPIHVARRPELK